MTEVQIGIPGTERLEKSVNAVVKEAAPHIHQAEQKPQIRRALQPPPTKADRAEREAYTQFQFPGFGGEKLRTWSTREELDKLAAERNLKPITDEERERWKKTREKAEKYASLTDEERQEILKSWMKDWKDRYPDWWKVYDKDGNHIWKMSPQHKASLARMRHFDSLPPEEKYKWLCQLREQSDKYLRLAGFKDETAGEKFAKVIEILFALILALISPVEENSEQPARPTA